METSTTSMDSTRYRTKKNKNRSNVYNRTKHHEDLGLFLLPMDNPQSFENMIEHNDILALLQIITDIVTLKKALHNRINNKCDKPNPYDFQININEGIQHINKYISKIGDFFYDISNGYLKIMCQSLHSLQKSHCNQMVPLHDIIRKTPVVYKLLNLMKRKLNEPSDDSESTFIPTLTGDNVKNSCSKKRKNIQCNSDEEAIILTVIRDEIDGSEINNHIIPSLQHNQCLSKCQNIAAEHAFFVKRSRLLEAQMDKINTLNGKSIFSNYQMNPNKKYCMLNIYKVRDGYL